MSDPFSFELVATDPCGARMGKVHTAHGTVETPIFMPVGTQGTVKAMTPGELKGVGAQIVLANTYHLFLRPGHEIVGRLGGLHRFMNWDRPILTDSGGFQIFSLGALCKISEEGALFRSHIDGSKHFLSPENAVSVQETLGSDIMMQLDECPPADARLSQVESAMALSLRWAGRGKSARDPEKSNRALFGIMQGGIHEGLRRESAFGLVDLGFDGYAMGGLSVGESREAMLGVLSYAPHLLPLDKPRYLMGVGKPEDIVDAVACGVDMFDCVLPTRNARNGQLFTRQGPFNIKRAENREDAGPVDRRCGCETCRHYSRAYLRHLYVNREILGLRLMTLHNLFYYLDLAHAMKEAIGQGRFISFQKAFHRALAGEEAEY
ncbi:MAG: tRNA-guanine transglycosylase [Magnetococcales bacterium]|nr:tRNA-guanine transglycosylase [Magnetococcales bacterium]HIJ82999.1 tRNA guanosine(34) transglycosylase Tgt [Magnetococcales bacterium]